MYVLDQLYKDDYKLYKSKISKIYLYLYIICHIWQVYWIIILYSSITFPSKCRKPPYKTQMTYIGVILSM